MKLHNEITVGIGGEAGDGIARTGDSLGKVCARHGLHVFAYNSYQSVIRGGHVWLKLRISQDKITNHGSHLNVMIALNKDTIIRHYQELDSGGGILYSRDVIPDMEISHDKVPLLDIPSREICKDLGSWKPLMQNTVLLGALIYLLNFGLQELEEVLTEIYKHKGDEVVKLNISVARRGYEYAQKNFQPFSIQFPRRPKRYAVTTGNEMMALGALAAGCRFYSAYPMTPASSILHWFAKYGPDLGVVVKQCEDELAVINMAIGAGFAGLRALCATSGGGFSLMTEAIGQAGMTETPVVIINSQRGGPSTGLPTKTEQGDFWQLFGASQGEYPKMILAPTNILDCYYTMIEAFNFAERYQMPVLVASDLYLSEHRETVDPDDISADVPINRGEILRSWDTKNPYLRYQITPTGVSPRVLTGTPNAAYTAATDEHDERGIIISDVYTDPVKRKQMMDKRYRKMHILAQEIPPIQVVGPQNADVTLVGWGSTRGILEEVAELLTNEGIPCNVIPLKYLWPLSKESLQSALESSRKVIFVEQNQTGQILRHVRAETGFQAHHFVAKYDGEPMDPQYVINEVKEILS